MVTLTTFGYRHFTENLILSLSALGLEGELHVYCLDSGAMEYFSGRYHVAAVYYLENKLNIDFSDSHSYGAQEFVDTVMQKFNIIHEVLLSGHDLFFVDGDVVFRKNPLPYLQSESIDCDILIQCNNGETSEVNTGFFVLKANEATIRAYELGRIDAFRGLMDQNLPDRDDQTLVNRFIIGDLESKLLPEPLFPNGRYFYQNSESCLREAFVVHFNWIMAAEKVKTMLRYGMWLLKDSAV